jgi:hypothetical protein
MLGNIAISVLATLATWLVIVLRYWWNDRRGLMVSP